MLKVVLIDDEISSLNALRQKIVKYCPELEIVSCNDNPQEGMDAIEALQPDLVFLDIEMPVINGFSLLQQLTNKNFEIIFVTAYDHYAVKAIRYSALEYLVKPVEIDELKTAVTRAVEKRKIASPNQQLNLLIDNISKEKIKRIAIPTSQGLQFIKVDNIIYLEANINYTWFNLLNNEKYLVSKTLKEFEDLLPADTFLRIHNSYIINKNYVDKYIRGEGGEVLLSNGKILEVSKRKKAVFLKAIGY